MQHAADHNERRQPRILMLLSLLVLAAAGPARAVDLDCSSSIPLAGGRMVVCWKENAREEPTRHLLVHFHGAPATVQQAFTRCDINAVLVVVNFPGLSTAYSRPFQTDRRLFITIVERAKATYEAAIASESWEGWNRISVSTFSAGYGAVREIIKTQDYFDQIDAIVAADSIYAGLAQEVPERKVNEKQMSDFLRFASLAVAEEKTFLISHGALQTPYASTAETADYLLRALEIDPTEDRSIQIEGMRQVTHASRGSLLVLGFAGTEGKDHLQHLHNIDLLWKRLAIKR